MTYVQRAITVIINAASASSSNPKPLTFGPSNSNTLTLAGYRVTATVELAGGLSMTSADITIYGLTPNLIQTMASLGSPFYAAGNNTISLMVGDEVNGMSLIFQGTITTAFADLSAQPQAAFVITSLCGQSAALTPIAPTSFSGPTNVATILQNLAGQANFTFENNGVSVTLNNPYHFGTALDQIKAVCKAARINFVIDQNNLAIWPSGGSRGLGVPTISPSNGLISYPTFTAFGIEFSTVFNPGLQFGSIVNVQSSLAAATGKWQIYGLTHTLESITPHGEWRSDVQAGLLGSIIVGQ